METVTCYSVARADTNSNTVTLEEEEEEEEGKKKRSVQRSGVSERQRAHVEAVRPAAFNWPRDTVSRVHSRGRVERDERKEKAGYKGKGGGGLLGSSPWQRGASPFPSAVQCRAAAAAVWCVYWCAPCQRPRPPGRPPAIPLWSLPRPPLDVVSDLAPPIPPTGASLTSRRRSDTSVKQKKITSKSHHTIFIYKFEYLIRRSNFRFPLSSITCLS